MPRGLDISDMFRSLLSNTQRTQSPNAHQIDNNSPKLMKVTSKSLRQLQLSISQLHDQMIGDKF